MGFTVRALAPDTWEAFAALRERNNGGGMGGCWCTWIHGATMADRRVHDDWRAYKHELVCADRAHAALVFDGEDAVGWSQFGSPAELPGIRHRAAVEAGGDLPDYRITCFYVDRRSRSRGVATAALAGAVELIAAAGGGVVDAYLQDLEPGRRVSASFLQEGTRAMFADAGFTFLRPKGKRDCIMRRTVEATEDPS